MSTKSVRKGLGVSDSASDFVELSAHPNGACHFMTLEAPPGTDYAVPAGKKLVIFQSHAIPSANNQSYHFLYGSDGVADGIAAPTAPIYEAPDYMYNVPATGTRYDRDALFVTPEGKYPCIKINSVVGDIGIKALGILMDS